MAPLTSFASLVDSSTAFVVPAVDDLSDAALLQLQRDLAEFRRRVDAWSASAAGQIAQRSRPELGHGGLAQRNGARTPELLVQHLSGTSARESHTMVRVGVLLAEPLELSSVSAAVSDGRLSLDAADAIRAGLHGLGAEVPTDLIADAAESLVDEAATLTVERLASRAREWAAELDEAHIQDRERTLRESRFLRLTLLRDGMTRLTGLLDPGSAAVVAATFDAITSPRRGGPRFIDSAARAYADQITSDSRTTEQIAVDSFVQLIRLGGDAAPEIVGAQRPAVRVIVTDGDLHRRAGYGQYEGRRDPISIPTIDAEICDRGMIPVHFDDTGQPVDLGVARRLHSRRQRIALALRDGGCRFLSCDRPPSWCEAHHIIPWREGGPSTVDNGILLCRHHHLLLHDHGWGITRDGNEYRLIPPASLDASRTPIAAPPKTRMVTRALEAGGSRSELSR